MTLRPALVRARSLASLALCLVTLGSGCRAIDFYAPLQANEIDAPRELSMVSLPAYRIEPPDLLRLEVLKAVPQPTYRLGAFDLVLVRTVGVLPERPIDGNFSVDADGMLTFGPPYAKVRVLGLTTSEAAAAIRQTLQLLLQNPEVTVQVLQSAGTQFVSGNYQVEPDGVLRLQGFGEVHVAGMTITEASQAVEQQLAHYFDSPRVGVEVLRYNSKSYYVIMPDAGSGESVRRFPITGNETVLDAIGEIQQFSRLSSKTMWVARAAPDTGNGEQILPVDWEAISRGGETKTNYQLMPGDRLYIADDSLVGFNYYLGTLTGPIDRLLGIANLGVNTVKGSQTMGRAYNANRRD